MKTSNWIELGLMAVILIAGILIKLKVRRAATDADGTLGLALKADLEGTAIGKFEEEDTDVSITGGAYDKDIF